MKVILIMSILFLFTGCAAKKLVVDNADTLLGHQITKRLPLYSKQEDALAKDLDKYLEKSKTSAQELLPVIDKIKTAEIEKIEEEYEKVEDFYKKTASGFSELFSKYMAKLDSKQQKEFFETLDDENREMLKKEKEKRIDEIEERFDMFLGSITGPQKQLIREYSDYFMERTKNRLDNRIKLHEKFREIYQSDISESSKAESFHEAFKQYQTDMLKGNKNLELLKKVVPTLKDSQKEYFREKSEEIKDLIKYFMTVDY